MKLINILYCFDLLLLLISDSYQDIIKFDLGEKLYRTEKLYSFYISYFIMKQPVERYIISPYPFSYAKQNNPSYKYLTRYMGDDLSNYISPFVTHPSYKQLVIQNKNLELINFHAINCTLDDIGSRDQLDLISFYVNAMLRSNYNNTVTPIIILKSKKRKSAIYNLIFPLDVSTEVYSRYLYVCLDNIITTISNNEVYRYLAKCNEQTEVLIDGEITLKASYISSKVRINEYHNEYHIKSLMTPAYIKFNKKDKIIYAIGEPIEEIDYPLEYITSINNTATDDNEMLFKYFVSIKSISSNIFAIVYGTQYKLHVVSQSTTSFIQFINNKHHSCVTHNCKPLTICVVNTTQCSNRAIILVDIKTNSWKQIHIPTNSYLMNNPLKYSTVRSSKKVISDSIIRSHNIIYDRMEKKISTIRTVNTVLKILSIIVIAGVLISCIIMVYQCKRVKRLNNLSYPEEENPLS